MLVSLLIGGMFIFGTVVALLTTPVVIKFAKRQGIVASSWYGEGSQRTSVPLLGGIPIFFVFILGCFIVFQFIDETILPKHIIGIILGAGVLVIGGYLDDKYSLSPKKQLIWPIIAIALVITSGIGISSFTNPFSPEKLIYVDAFKFDLLTFRGIPYRIALPADIISFVWLALIMYSTKLQDGLDGLVSGISFIGSVFIFLLSYFVFDDIPLSLLSALFSGTLLGFLRYNTYPAKIFLGESGSLLTGFILGVLAILSDAKIIVTLLVLALPIGDAIWTVLRRLYNRQAPWQGDQLHLHHRLIQVGFSPRRAVFLLYGITAIFGMLVLLWQSSFTYYFFGIATLLIGILLTLFISVYKLHSQRKS